MTARQNPPNLNIYSHKTAVIGPIHGKDITITSFFALDGPYFGHMTRFIKHPQHRPQKAVRLGGAPFIPDSSHWLARRYKRKFGVGAAASEFDLHTKDIRAN
jgi:hypothetical protein